MSVMASARVEDELHAQASDILKQLGATQTQLINAAFEHVVRTRTLPGSPTTAAEPEQPKKRVMTEQQRAFLTEFFQQASLPAPAFPEGSLGTDGTEYDGLLAQALAGEYEDLR
ncbi:MAG: type II toxin-antitoxin system RelB/DinJ family antitoxin [Coriobacteriia bacterium]|nr:type II toxin-antitoxin system RelB/DinJ family antitoxin [Coriobacteriia bacterium]